MHQVQARHQDPASGSIAAIDRRLTLIAFVATSLFALGHAAAQNSDAEALFTEAERLESSGKIAEACDAFEASNRIEPRAGTLIRLGQCRENQKHLVSAWSAYKDALTRAKDPAKRQLAEQRVAALQSRLSYLTVLVPDESRVDGLVIKRNNKELDAALWNRAAPVDGGVYTISGHAPGHEEWSTTVEVANEGDKSSIEVPRFKELRKLVDETPVGPVKDPEETDDTGPSMFTGKRKAALGVAGVGVVALAAGMVFGSQAKGLESDSFDLCPDPNMACANAAEAQEKHDSATSKALLANISLGVGGAAVIGAAVLWFTGAPKATEDEQVGVHPTIGPGYSGVDVLVRF